MKLISCVPFHVLAIPGIRAPSGMTIKPGEGSWAAWSLATRGPSVFLISPPGWRVGQPPEGDARQVFEIPRSHCHLQWEFDALDGFEGVVKWDASPAVVVSPADARIIVKSSPPADSTKDTFTGREASIALDGQPGSHAVAPPLRATPLQEPAVEGANPAAQASPVPPAGEGLTSQSTVRRFERKQDRR